MVCVGYPSRASYLDLQQDAAYRAALPDRRAGLARRLLYVMRPAAPPGGTFGGQPIPLEPVSPSSAEEVFVINLLRYRGAEGLAAYLRYGEVVAPEVEARGGAAVLAAEGELPLVSDGFWHDALLVRYPSIDTLTSMVAEPKWQAANEHRMRGLHQTIAFPTQPVRIGRR